MQISVTLAERLVSVLPSGANQNTLGRPCRSFYGSILQSALQSIWLKHDPCSISQMCPLRGRIRGWYESKNARWNAEGRSGKQSLSRNSFLPWEPKWQTSDSRALGGLVFISYQKNVYNTLIKKTWNQRLYCQSDLAREKKTLLSHKKPIIHQL